LGSGRQWLSWIHLTDALRIIEHALIAEAPASLYNAVAPEPVRHRVFAREVGMQGTSILRLPVPGLLVGALAGEMAEELLLNGQRVLPVALEQEAFQFDYASLSAAIKSCLATSSD
jgi:NAD dependent epimerase/dehydratase family enzyme